MDSAATNSATLLLQAACRGDRQAVEELLPLVYEELRKLARSRMADLPPGQTLQPTALVHEAYLRLLGNADPGWDSRGHFFAAAARAMRDILVEQARRKASRRHGGGVQRVQADDSDLAVLPPTDDVLALDEALRHLEAEDPRKGEIVNLRYFAGLTAAETAAALGVSKRTIDREWRYIGRWLYLQLAERRSSLGGDTSNEQRTTETGGSDLPAGG